MSGADAFEGEPDLKSDDKPVAAKEKSRFFSDRLRHRLRNIGAAAASVAAVGAVGSGLLGYWNIWKTVKTEIFHEGQSPQQYAASRPDVTPRLSLVVLPFANLNNDPEQDYFADGITTDLTTDLGRMPGAFVIGRGTAFTYKNKQVELKMLGKELGIRWAVQGAVQRNGDDVRINVALTDLSTGGDFWSDRFAGERGNLADLQDQIVVRLELFDEALRLDPNDVDAMLGKSWCLSVNALFQWSASPESDLSTAVELVDRAFTKRPPSALAHVVKGHALRIGHPETALAEYDAALQIDPNYPPAYFFKGIELTELGRAREALVAHQIALRLSPKDPLAARMHYGLCHAHVHIREYAEAIDECRRSINLNEAQWYAYVDLVVAYGAIGQREQSRQALAELYRMRPGFTIEKFQQVGFSLSSNPQFRKEFSEILVSGLREAGAKER